MQDNKPYLVAALRRAVPLWWDQVEAHPVAEQPKVIERWRAELRGSAATYFDDFLNHWSGTPGRAAWAFDQLARSIVVLSTASGGVDVFGLNFCAYHSRAGRITRGLCDDCVFLERMDNAWGELGGVR